MTELSPDDSDLRRRAEGYRPLTDRPSVQAPLARLLEQGRSVALVGPKRVGKTSILLALSRTLPCRSIDYRIFDEGSGRSISEDCRPGTVRVFSQAELLTASRSVNSNLLEDRIEAGERLVLEFRDSGREAFASRYPMIAKHLVTVEVKAPEATECRQLLDSARTRLKETAQLEIADDVLEEADRLARDRWRAVVPPWPTIIALWTAGKIHRETSARGDLQQLEEDLRSSDRTPQEIELLRQHLEGLRSISGMGLTIESIRRAIGELSGENAIPG